MPGGLVQVRVPVRIDFAGGWSDVPNFSGQEGGAVLNAAINRYAEGEARWDGEGLRVSYRLGIGPDSHLGTSSSFNLAWLELIHALTGKAASPVDLGREDERARRQALRRGRGRVPADPVPRERAPGDRAGARRAGRLRHAAPLRAASRYGREFR